MALLRLERGSEFNHENCVDVPPGNKCFVNDVEPGNSFHFLRYNILSG